MTSRDRGRQRRPRIPCLRRVQPLDVGRRSWMRAPVHHCREQRLGAWRPRVWRYNHRAFSALPTGKMGSAVTGRGRVLVQGAPHCGSSQRAPAIPQCLGPWFYSRCGLKCAQRRRNPPWNPVPFPQAPFGNTLWETAQQSSLFSEIWGGGANDAKFSAFNVMQTNLYSVWKDHYLLVPVIMTWNYRILKIGAEFGIHEVFYDKAANPISYTLEKVSPRGDSLEAFRLDFSRFQDALNMPVLMVSDNDEIVEFSQGIVKWCITAASRHRTTGLNSLHNSRWQYLESRLSFRYIWGLRALEKSIFGGKSDVRKFLSPF